MAVYLILAGGGGVANLGSFDIQSYLPPGGLGLHGGVCAVISGGRISCLEFCDERLIFQLYLRSGFLCVFNLYDTEE